MGAPLITAAMIVRDEEAHLPACLESIRDVVDEIVIVDTGSTDDTLSIAKSFGARVVAHPWTGSFAEPRNVGLDLATGRWILYIDADERLRPVPPPEVRARLEAAEEVALRVRLRPFKDATPYWEYRLWRSDPRIRFTGKMHERVTGALHAVAEQDHRPIGESELFLEHVGYEGDQTRKHRRNLPLLRAGLADDPSDPYSWHHLAVVLEGLGEREQSEAALEQGVVVARRTLGTAGVLPFLRLILDRLARGIDPGDVLEEALARYPDSFGLSWLKVLAEMKAGRYEEALRRLEPFDVDPEMPVEDVAAYPTELFGARAAEARATCLFKLGRYREAASAYAKAEGFEPDAPAHRLRRALAEHRASRIGSSAPAPASGFRWPARGLMRGLTLDIAGIPVGVTVTDAMRAASVRALLGRLEPTDEPPRSRLVFCGHRPLLPDRDPDVSVDPVRVWYDRATMSIAYGQAIGARVEAGSATVGGYNTTENLSQMFRCVGPLMLAGLLGAHGRFILHAGAIHRDGRAALILGGSGMGKSTLVLGALQDGWSVMSDDLVVVCPSPTGPTVAGIPKPLRVPGELLGDDQRTASPADPRSRLELPFESWDTKPRRVELIVVVGHGDGSAAVTEPIERQQLLQILIDLRLSPDPFHVRPYFRLAAALLDVPAFYLRHSGVPEIRAGEAAAALTARLEASRVCS